MSPIDNAPLKHSIFRILAQSWPGLPLRMRNRVAAPLAAMGRIAAIAVLALCGWSHILTAQSNLDELRTVAESSQFKRTSLSNEVAEFVDVCSGVPHVRRVDFGETVEGRPMIAALVSRKPAEWTDRDDRLRVLVIGNIHSGECDGKEALLMILRRLALHPDHPWLDNMVIAIAPNYNADGNDRIGPNHRPGQGGPEDGMGIRENAQQLDLNRDFIKIESPEAQSLVHLIDQFDPHIFIDCHTTNGSIHRYGLTYDVPHHPAAPESVRNYLRQQFMPQVTERLENNGLLTYYYGNFNSDKTRWTTYGYEPRYSTEYIGMRGRIGILSESYSYSTYEERIRASDQFVSACLQQAHENAGDIRDLLNGVEQQFVERARENPQSIQMALEAKMIPFNESVQIKGLDDAKQPQDYEVTFYGQYEPVHSVHLPFAYVLPEEFSLQADRLKKHGIQVEALTGNLNADVSVYRVDQIKKAARAFQNHHMVAVETTERTENRELPAGSYLIRTGQPLGALAACLLEPGSVDGLVTWNFFDPQLVVGGDYPVVRIPEPIEIKSKEVSQVSGKMSIDVALIYGADSPWTERAPVPDWMPDDLSYLQQWDGWTTQTMQVDVVTGGMSPSPDQNLRELRSALGGHADLSALRESLLSGQRKIGPDGHSVFVTTPNDIVRWDPKSNEVVYMAHSTAPIQLWTSSADCRHVAYVSGNNLFVAAAVDSVWQLTDNGDHQHLNGILDWVYQEELFGRGDFQGHWFSPSGNQIAFLRFDETGVPEYSIADDSTIASTQSIGPYPNAGDRLPKVELCVADLEQRQIRTADLGREADGSLIAWAGWNRTGQQVAFFRQDRQQTWLDLCTFDPANANVETLFRDQPGAWIRRPPAPVWLADGRFLWISPRGGLAHLYLYSADGVKGELLTPGDWQVSKVHGVSADDRFVFFSGTPRSPLRTQVIRLDLRTMQQEILTEIESDHVADFSPDLGYFFDSSSRVDRPVRIDLRDANGKLIRTIWDPPVSDTLRQYRTQAPAFAEVPTRDGGVLDGMWILPPDFDPAHKYPVIMHVYGGPQSPNVRDQFRGASYLWHQMLAQRGYVIWMCDNRSASRRSTSAAWETRGQLGRLELQDIEDSLDWLGRHPWIDTDRIGIWGWSYGGFLTAYSLTHSNRFKVGVAGAPVTDWRNYDAIYTERLMGLPGENSMGYDQSSVVRAAGNLKGMLMLVHGTVDDNVHISNTLQLAAELQRVGKDFRLMLYPQNRHAITQPDQRLHCWRTIADFFVDNL